MALLLFRQPTAFAPTAASPFPDLSRSSGSASTSFSTKTLSFRWAKRPSNAKTRRTGVDHLRAQACINPFEDQPIIRDALKEPVAFMGGMFAGLLRLDLNEDPLKEWVSRTVEDAEVEGEIDAEEGKLEGGDSAPQQIEIE